MYLLYLYATILLLTVQSHIEPCTLGEVVGDNCLGLNRAGVFTLLQRYTRNTELVYASFANDTHRKPFVVVLDHEKEAVVLAVRGTLSLEDCVTDVLCDPTEVCLLLIKKVFDTFYSSLYNLTLIIN